MAERWIASVAADRLDRRPIVAVRIDGFDLVLVRHSDEIYACERACPHEQADLCLGHIADGRLHCPRHLTSFGLEDGKISPGWQSRNLRRYPARIVDGVIWVDIGNVSG